MRETDRDIESEVERQHKAKAARTSATAASSKFLSPSSPPRSPSHLPLARLMRFESKLTKSQVASSLSSQAAGTRPNKLPFCCKVIITPLSLSFSVSLSLMTKPFLHKSFTQSLTSCELRAITLNMKRTLYLEK